MKKKRILISSFLAVILVAGGLAYRAYASSQAASSAGVQTVAVQRGSLSATLSASGNVRSGQSAVITWQTSGKVSDITLQTGDLVQSGRELAALDPNSLSTEMINAQQDLIDAQQAMDDLLNSKTQQAQALQAVEDAQQTLDTLQQTAAEESSQAQLALAEAQSALEDAQANRTKMNYPHSSDTLVIEKAQTDYLLAKKAYKQALDDYQQVQKKKLTNPERVLALNNLVSAKQKMDTAFAAYNWYLQDYTAEDIAQAGAELAVAQANLEKAQADYDNLKNGATAGAIALAEANLADAQREYERVKDGPSQEDIAAAQAAIDAAQATLDHARLLAPFTGTITEVDVSAGDLVSSGDAAFRIDDLASTYVDLQISEVDLASLEVGQPATLEFDAIEGKTYHGQVTQIGMVGSVSSGVVTYPVTVKLTDAGESVRQGMTASVTITVAQVDDMLLVPNKAIHNSNSGQTVTVLFEGQQISIPVTVSLMGDSMSAVTSDQLQEGDAVVVAGSTASTTSSTTSTNQAVNPGAGLNPGMGGPPPGGMP